MGALATAFLDIVGTPCLIAKTGNTLALGTQGPQSLYLRTNETVIKEIDSNGYQLDSGSIATGLVAAGASQGTALQLAKEQNVVGTTAASTGVILPVGKVGMKIIVHNRGANSLSVYPETGGAIDGGSANAAVAVAAGKSRVLMCTALLTWNSLLGA